MVFLLPYSLPPKGKKKVLASCVTLVIPSNKFPQIPPPYTHAHSLSLSLTHILSLTCTPLSCSKQCIK